MTRGVVTRKVHEKMTPHRVDDTFPGVPYDERTGARRSGPVRAVPRAVDPARPANSTSIPSLAAATTGRVYNPRAPINSAHN